MPCVVLSMSCSFREIGWTVWKWRQNMQLTFLSRTDSTTITCGASETLPNTSKNLKGLKGQQGRSCQCSPRLCPVKKMINLGPLRRECTELMEKQNRAVHDEEVKGLWFCSKAFRGPQPQVKFKINLGAWIGWAEPQNSRAWWSRTM